MTANLVQECTTFERIAIKKQESAKKLTTISANITPTTAQVSPTKRSHDQVSRARESPDRVDKDKFTDGVGIKYKSTVPLPSPQASPTKQSRADNSYLRRTPIKESTAQASPLKQPRPDNGHLKRTPIKESTPPVKASPAKQFVSVRYDFQPKNVSHLIASRSPQKPQPQSLSVAKSPAKPCASPVKPCASPVTVASAKSSSSNLASDIDTRPMVSVKSRVQALHANRNVSDTKLGPCPEKLPVRAKASLFEKAIEEEALRAAEIRSRDRFLKQRKLGAPVQPEDEPKNLQKIVRSTSITKPNITSTTPKVADVKESNATLEQTEECSDAPQSASCSKDSNVKADEKSALEAFREIDAMQSGIAESSRDQDQLYADASHTGQNSLSSDTSDRTSGSNESGRMYPGLPVVVEDAEYYHSSPTKQVQSELHQMNVSPTKQARVVEQASTPMRTLSSYRLQQKQRAQMVEETKPSIVYGQRKTKVEDEIESERQKEIARRQVHELKQQAKVQEEVTLQASKAIGMCLASAVGSHSHVDAEKTLLVSSKFPVVTSHS